MELTNWTAPEGLSGDRLSCRDLADAGTPLVVCVREYRTGIKTQHTQDGDGVVVDAVNLITGEISIDVLWMPGAVTDGLKGYIGHMVAIKMVWTTPKQGGNKYVGLEQLGGLEQQTAAQWATQHGLDAFERVRLERQAENGQLPAASSAPTLGTLPSNPPAPAAPAPAPAAPAAEAKPDPMADPAIAELLKKLAEQQGKT